MAKRIIDKAGTRSGSAETMQLHRIQTLEAIFDYKRQLNGVLYWTGEEILDWYLPCAS